MRVLFLGDIVGKSGRLCMKEQLPKLKLQYRPDLVIANGENAAHGKGITKRIYHELLGYGIDMITMGNHTFSKSDIYQFINEADRLVRPANMEPLGYGRSTQILQVNTKRVAISNLCAQIFMNNVTESPFSCMERILAGIDVDYHFVDLHGETTSEKIAFTYQFAGRVQAVIGTHTHVQTADERIINGCAAISDLGMCGAYNSVLGRDTQEVLDRFIKQSNTHYKIAEGPAILCGLVVDFDDTCHQAVQLERIQIRPKLAKDET